MLNPDLLNDIRLTGCAEGVTHLYDSNKDIGIDIVLRPIPLDRVRNTTIDSGGVVAQSIDNMATILCADRKASPLDVHIDIRVEEAPGKERAWSVDARIFNGPPALEVPQDDPPAPPALSTGTGLDDEFEPPAAITAPKVPHAKFPQPPPQRGHSGRR